MRLTRYTDYALRVLTYLGARPDRGCSIAEIARGYGLSQNHLMKVAHDLGKAGYIEGVRGRTGGIRLARPADKINVGAVVRQMEEDFGLVECFNTEGSHCKLDGHCRLKGVLSNALQAWMDVLDGVTLADLVAAGTAVSALPLTRIKRSARGLAA